MSRPKKTTVCPLGGTGVGGKWQTWIWYHLLGGTRRFGELRRLIPGASRQMLTIQLREMEQLGVIHRKVYEQWPAKVEYSLTELGRQSEAMFREFYAWGHWFCEQTGFDFDEWIVRISGRWKIWIWYLLLSGTRRFSELQRLLPQASKQTLATQLRELEHMGVVHRHVSAEETLKVEYSLTDLAQCSEPVLRQLYAWGRRFCEQAGLDYDWPVREESVERMRVFTREEHDGAVRRPAYAVS